MKVALLHDYLNQYGGAERVLEELMQTFPDAPIYTLLYAPKQLPDSFRAQLEKRELKVSSLNKAPFAAKKHKYYLWALPYMVEQWNFDDFDLLVSDSHSFAKGVISPPQTPHISYCHTPLRYVWDLTSQYQNDYPYPGLVKKLLPIGLHYLRIWDRQAAQRPDKLLTNSNFVKKRIKKYYNREAEIIPPPVKRKGLNTDKAPTKDFYLLVSRLIPYKKVDLAIKAFGQLGLPLKIIGAGPEEKKLKKLAGPQIDFLGEVHGEKLKKYYSKAKGFILPQKEDFGIAPIEAMTSGTPVIAFRAGGALDYIKEKKNGLFFKNQTPQSLIKAVKKFEKIEFIPKEIRKTTAQFDQKRFRSKIKKATEKTLVEETN